MSDFDEFWAEYPRKVGKAKAIRAYARALRGLLPLQVECGLGPATHDEIMVGLASYKRDKPDYADWKHGSVYLNSVSWIDEGGSDEIEHADRSQEDLAFKRREHEGGHRMWPTEARIHGWGEFGSEAKAYLARPELRVVG